MHAFAEPRSVAHQIIVVALHCLHMLHMSAQLVYLRRGELAWILNAAFLMRSVPGHVMHRPVFSELPR